MSACDVIFSVLLQSCGLMDHRPVIFFFFFGIHKTVIGTVMIQYAKLKKVTTEIYNNNIELELEKFTKWGQWRSVVSDGSAEGQSVILGNE